MLHGNTVVDTLETVSPGAPSQCHMTQLVTLPEVADGEGISTTAHGISNSSGDARLQERWIGVLSF